MSNNALGGFIPNEMGQVSKLTNLYLSYSSLSGSISSELGALVNLEEVDCSNIFVTGIIPETLCSSTYEFFSWIKIWNENCC
jgi:hypothetical protein